MANYPVYDAESSDQFWQTVKAARAADIDEPTVDLASLDTATKRRVWQHLKAHHPAYADLLQSTLLQALREHFDARVHLRRSLVTEALHGHH